MATEKIILEVGVQGTGDGETKIKSLKAQLKEMKNELLSMDEGSYAFKKLSAEAGRLEDKIGDVNQRVKALSSDTKKLDALVGVGSAITGGFQAAQGAMALFGSDSKQVEKAIQNIIAAQGILNGVQQVGQFLTAKGIVQDALASAATAVKTGVTKAATAAQWLFNAAITANPIGLIVVGVAALTAGIGVLIRGIKNGTITIEDITKVMWRMIMPLQLIVDLYNYLTEATEDNETALEKNSKANTEAYKKAVAEANERRRVEKLAFEDKQNEFDLNIARAEAEGKSTVELTRQKLQALLDERKAVLAHNQELINLMVARYEAEAAFRGKSLDEFLKSIGINKEQTQKVLEDQLQEQKDAIFSAETDLIKFNTDTRNASIEENKKKNDELLKQEQDRIAQQKKLEAELRERELEADQLFAERLQKEKDERKKLADEEREAESKRRIAEAEAEIELEKEKQAAKQKLVEDYTTAVKDLTTNIFTLTNNLGKQDEESRNKRAKRQFQIKKALDMAEAAIDGTKAVLSTFANTPGGLVIKGLAATAAGVFAAAKIAAIGSAKFDGGASVSGSVGGGGDAGASASNVGNVTPNIQGIPAGSTLLNQPTQKVVVVESDITKVQKKVGVIEAQATYG